MGFSYMIAVDKFVDAMVNYGTGGPHSVKSMYMPSWVCSCHLRSAGMFNKRVQSEQHRLRTLNALAVIRVLGSLKEKPEWEIKVENEEIVAKWKVKDHSRWKERHLTKRRKRDLLKASMRP